jgi:rubrerythrin
MISRTDPREATKSLSDLRRAQPADATLKNLLGVLSAKLELCASLPVYEWEAASEGYEESASAFRELAEAERRSCRLVIDRLREHLERRAGTQGGSK